MDKPWNIASVVVHGRVMTAARAFARYDLSDDSEIEVDESNILRATLPEYAGRARNIDEFQAELSRTFCRMLDQLTVGGVKLDTVVIGTLGPIVSTDMGLARAADPRYGQIARNRPYEYWGGMNFYALARKFFQKHPERSDGEPLVLVRTDASLRALGEARVRLRNDNPDFDSVDYREARDETVVAYLKLSREVSLGVSHHGTLWRGRLHPLFGMTRVDRMRVGDRRDEFRSTCPHHADCLEGLIGLEALECRLTQSGAEPSLSKVQSDDPILDVIADYAAKACLAITATFTPSLIVLGGRVVRDVLGGDRDGYSVDLVNRVSARFGALISESFVETIHYPELMRPEGFIQGTIGDLSGLYGGLVFASLRGRRESAAKSGH